MKQYTVYSGLCGCGVFWPVSQKTASALAYETIKAGNAEALWETAEKKLAGTDVKIVDVTTTDDRDGQTYVVAQLESIDGLGEPKAYAPPSEYD